MHCPRCEPQQTLGDDGRCSSCGGRVLVQAAAERLLRDELGQDIARLQRIAEMFAGERLPCPACGGQQSPMQLKGVPVDLCLGCGAVWLDAGEDEQLRDRARAAPRPPPVKELPPREVLHEDPVGSSLARLFIGVAVFGLCGAGAVAGVAAGRWLGAGFAVVAGLSALAVAILMSVRARVVLDREQGVLELFAGPVWPRPKRRVRFDEVEAVERQFIAGTRSTAQSSGSSRVYRLLFRLRGGRSFALPFATTGGDLGAVHEAVAAAAGIEVDHRLHEVAGYRRLTG